MASAAVSGVRPTDRAGVGVLTRLVDRDLVDEVLVDTGRAEKRSRLLPARVVECDCCVHQFGAIAPGRRRGRYPSDRLRRDRRTDRARSASSSGSTTARPRNCRSFRPSDPRWRRSPTPVPRRRRRHGRRHQRELHLGVAPGPRAIVGPAPASVGGTSAHHEPVRYQCQVACSAAGPPSGRASPCVTHPLAPRNHRMISRGPGCSPSVHAPPAVASPLPLEGRPAGSGAGTHDRESDAVSPVSVGSTAAPISPASGPRVARWRGGGAGRVRVVWA